MISASLLLALLPAALVGPQTCALCHKNIAQTQSQTAMAKTWVAQPPAIDAREGNYRLFSKDNELFYTAGSQSFPVAVTMGGGRHGLGFLFKVDEANGQPLVRPAMVQARYFWNAKHPGSLSLAPGLSEQDTLGLVLSPAFEKQCLQCHGQAQGGVHCESCHGPGSLHVAASGKGGIVNSSSMEVCAPCHAGFGRHLDPAPADLLIANQVTALRSSECFRQSGGAFTCTACHDPHRDQARITTRVCLGCHSQLADSHAVADCASCHMPTVDVGPLHLVDHQIRVHPDRKDPSHARAPSGRKPVREYLRVIRNGSLDKILEAQRSLANGNVFYDVARAFSEDSAASIGGFWGDKEMDSLEPALRAAAITLNYGQFSGVTESGGRYYLLQRLPRDFKWQASQLPAQDALKVYPVYRRALLTLATTFAQNGSLKRAGDVFGLVAKLYPEDAEALFSQAEMLSRLNRPAESIAAYRRAVQLEPDFVAAYAKLAELLGAQGDEAGAAAVLRQRLEIDPLSR